MRFSLRLLSVLAVSSAAAGLSLACTSESSTPSSSADAGSSETGSSTTPNDSDAGGGSSDAGVPDADAASDAGTCNELAQQGQLVDVVAAPLPAPTPAGGAWADGTYTLTAAKAYGAQGAPGQKLFSAGKVTMELSGTTMTAVATDEDGEVSRRTVELTPNGADLSGDVTCTFPPEDGGIKSETNDYTATPTTFVLYTKPSPNGGRFELSFTKL